MRLIQVGLGGWGMDWARSVLPNVAGVRVAAYVDADPAVLARAGGLLNVGPDALFPDLASAIRAVPADAVLATLPTARHAAICEAALRAGLNVLVEKPFTETLAQARGLAALAAQHGRVLMVSQNYRHHPAVATAADLLRRGVLGAPLGAHVEFRKNWRETKHRYHDIPGPLLLDMAVHHFDLLRMLLGEVTRLTCRSWTTPGSPFREHAGADVMFEMASGSIVGYHGTWLSQGRPTTWSGDWAIECERGVIAFRARGAPLPDLVRIHTADDASRDVPLLSVPAVDRAGTLTAFARAVATGRAPADFSDAADNVSTLALCFAAMRSAARGGEWTEPADLED